MLLLPRVTGAEGRFHRIWDETVNVEAFVIPVRNAVFYKELCIVHKELCRVMKVPVGLILCLTVFLAV